MPIARLRGYVAAHKFISAVVLVAVIGGGYYVYKKKTAVTAVPTYTLGVAEKGTLISSVAGSGQVSATDQLDVKSKASGEVTFVGTAQGKTVKKGDVIVRLDSRDAVKAVRDAQNSLDTARLSLEKLQAPVDALSMTQAENSVSSAARNVTSAENNLAQFIASSAQSTASAYDDGYTAVSDAYLDMPNMMKDLKDLRGTDASSDANISSFNIILGEKSVLIANWLHDHDAALAAYNDNFAYFKTVPRASDDATRYDLMLRTLQTENLIAQALQSAHAMLDASVNNTYKQYQIASTIDTYRPKILSDISQVNGDISSTQRNVDTIDGNKRDYPINLKQKQDAVTAANESLKERTESLAKLKAGVDPLDLRSSQLTLQLRQEALADAQSKLADYTVVAPFDGTVATFSIKKGDQVSSNGAVATLVTSQRFADITLNEVDVVAAKVGQKATLTLDAIDGLSITGEVADVDLLGSVSQGVVNYGVRIQFDTQDERVRPGMSVSATVVTSVKTDALLVPSGAVKSSGGSTYVEMFDAHQSASERSLTTPELPRQQAVTTGGSNDTGTEILSGLKEGDVIVVKTATASSGTGAAAAQPQTGGISIPGLTGGGGNVRFQGGGGGGANFRR